MSPLPSDLRERLAALGLTSGQVAREIGVVSDLVRRITQEEMQLSAKMAQRLGRYFWTGADYWAELQMQFDLAVAARELACPICRHGAFLARTLIEEALKRPHPSIAAPALPGAAKRKTKTKGSE